MAGMNTSDVIQETTTPFDQEAWHNEVYWFWYNMPYQISIFAVRTIITMIIAGFGTFSNIVNLIIFYRQGFLADNCTPSLVGLAVADFASSSLGFAGGLIVSVNSWVAVAPCKQIYVGDLWYISYFVEKPRDTFIQITGWVTVYLSLERMISIAFPFHVKLIFTPKRSFIAIAVIYILSFIVQYPELLYQRLGKTRNAYGDLWWNQIRNSMVSDELRDEAAFANNVIFRSISVILIFVFNGTTILKLRLSGKFKKSATLSKTKPDSQGTTDEKGESNKAKKETSAQKTSKEVKVIRMMAVLCALFIICYAPTTVYFVLIYIPNEMFEMQPFFQHWYVILMIFLEYINSSVNIFVYYTMSTKYKKDMIQLFKCTD